MVYECEKCGTALPAGVIACPKCGEGFDEAVPLDAETPVRGWQPKSEIDAYDSANLQSEIEKPVAPRIIISQEYHPEPPNLDMAISKSGSQFGHSASHILQPKEASKPKVGNILGIFIVAICLWPITILYIIFRIWKRPTWSSKKKALIIGLIVTAVFITAEVINIQEGNSQAPQRNMAANPITKLAPIYRASVGMTVPAVRRNKTLAVPKVKQPRKETGVSEFFALIHGDNNATKINRILNSDPSLLTALSSENPGFGSPPLIEAVDDINIVRVLLAHGADVNIKSSLQSGSQSALHFACHDGYYSVAKLLISKGADISARTPEGETPLHLVSMEPEDGRTKAEQCKIARLLIQSGADVNATDSVGQTPLIDAADNTRLDIVKILIDNGANINAKAVSGFTAFDSVKDSEPGKAGGEIRSYLHAHGGASGY